MNGEVFLTFFFSVVEVLSTGRGLRHKRMSSVFGLLCLGDKLVTLKRVSRNKQINHSLRNGRREHGMRLFH